MSRPATDPAAAGERPESEVAMDSPLISVRGLKTEFHAGGHVVQAVNGVSFDVYPGETVAIVGESGSGKSVTAMSMVQLIPQPPGRIAGGEVIFEGRNLLEASKRQLRKIRGGQIAMVFQDPMASLTPVLTISQQICETLRTHNRGMSRAAARAEAVSLLEKVGIPDPVERADQYPHEYSGGMRQRAMVAIAMANRPKLLIADEPTTALDVTVQAQVLEVLEEAKRQTKSAMILITHDLGLVAEIADRVLVMYGGRVVETGTVTEIFEQPRHPYTLGLMASMPRIGREVKQLVPIPGQPPNATDLPPGCVFQPRCQLTRGRTACVEEVPPLVELATGRATACHFHDEMAAETERVSQEMGIDVTGSRT